LDYIRLNLTVGEESTLTATVSPSNAANKAVTWSTNNSGVATVNSNGRVTAVGVGTATIVVTTVDGNRTASCTVTVTNTTHSGAGILTITGLPYGSWGVSVFSPDTVINTVADCIRPTDRDQPLEYVNWWDHNYNEIKLVNWDNDSSPWTGSGRRLVVIHDVDYYKAIVNFSNGSATVPFSSFTKLPNS
jgi:hypothetical protein